MKIQKITAYIQPFALDSMVDALFASGACGITVSEVSGKGRSKSSHLVPRICLELCVQETAVKKILDTIKKSSHSTQHGAGQGNCNHIRKCSENSHRRNWP